MKRPNHQTHRFPAKRLLQHLLCCLGLSTLLVVLATAQEFQIGGLSGVHTANGHSAAPAFSYMYSNCGNGCVNYDHINGYDVAGAAYAPAPGQTLAVQFTASGAPIKKVIEVNSIFAGPANSQIGAVLLQDAAGVPGAPLRGGVLMQQRRPLIPAWPASAPIKYTAKKPLRVRRGTKLWLCQWEPYPTTAGLWMENSQNDFGPFFFNMANTCNASPGLWVNVTGQALRPAFEIN